MPDSCITFGCNNKNDSENRRALYRIPSFNDHCPECVRRRKKKWIDFAISHSLCLFRGRMKPEKTPQSKLDPFSRIVVHGPKNCPTALLWKGTTSEGKMQGQKLFRHSKHAKKILSVKLPIIVSTFVSGFDVFITLLVSEPVYITTPTAVPGKEVRKQEMNIPPAF